MNDVFNLQRFVDAQENAYAGVLVELSRGRKSGHWIWYIFPQIAGLGYSQMSQRYAIASLEEARAYAAHPVLGHRLDECVRLMLAIEGKTVEQALGHVDAMKFRSCLTLFAAACEDNRQFKVALDRFFDGEQDPLTLQALA